MDRFLDRLKETSDGCWEWTGCLRGKNGYGAIKVNGILIDTHRYSYILFKGEIPKQLLVCHTCDNRKCVNPDHLFLGTYKDNHEDAVRKGRIVYGEKPHLRRHPSLSSYKRGCRCRKCKDVKAKSVREERLRRKMRLGE